ncbi:MAG: 3D-(3,5/4)-trihydroxycyclohexane-1,2-dione acylhydrolase (decyclizing) [Chloroflexi bacterium]|nr:MAG: 3D-(3,5/4)-trihydroxycyclohexane-1,2-dione acylhydrolase (decyclizing) [Chloroflexota bacterium]TMG65530.1 MAG: 3D-(3,5/4)-trihydroxycyclohexane-1,2-dione acylhydrolase (decyclizing) [Chloroflexota bacterium]
MKTVRLTMAQALVRFLSAQRTERDGVDHKFIEGCFGIFGHGNVTGVGQALAQDPQLLTYYQSRNEQAMVHTAAGFAKMRNRLATMACTTSIGPGATNMVTGAAAATVNRIPVLLLPGDVFASRRPDPVLQQLESSSRGDVSVNDAFIPVSRYFDRIERAEQLIPAALAAMRVLTSQADTGAVTLALPQDVQAEAFDYPAEFLASRVWHIGRQLPDDPALDRAVSLIRSAVRPLIVAGGGVVYSEASEVLRRFVARSGIPVAETQAGKGSLPFDHAGAMGGIGATGARAANRVAAKADLIIGIGTRYTDFTTASRTAFQNPDVRFVNINVAELDSHKLGGIPLTGDARATLESLDQRLQGWSVADEYRREYEQLRAEWDAEVSRLYNVGHAPLPAQSEVLGAVNDLSAPRDVVVCAAGSMPGDLHKLWRTRDVKGYHVEYGYSTMGYEIAGGLGVKLADPSREVYVMVGDGSYLMMSQEIVTSIQERAKLTVVLVDNDGFASIGGLSRSKGTAGFGTRYRYRENGSLGDDAAHGDGERLPVDLALNAEGLGAHVFRTRSVEELRDALVAAKKIDRTVVIHVPVDRYEGVPSYDSWWDVPVAEVSESADVKKAREEHEREQARRRWHL